MNAALKQRIDDLRRRLDDAIALERRVTEALAAQGDSLTRNGPRALQDASRALDAVYHELREVSDACRAAMDDVADHLPGGGNGKLADLVARLPGEHEGLGRELAARRDALLSARARRREQSTRNATLARAGLDALATVRRAIDGSLAGVAPGARMPLSRLDARV